MLGIRSLEYPSFLQGIGGVGRGLMDGWTRCAMEWSGVMDKGWMDKLWRTEVEASGECSSSSNEIAMEEISIA